VFVEDASAAAGLMEAGASRVFAETGSPAAGVRDRVGRQVARIVTDGEFDEVLVAAEGAGAGVVTGDLGVLSALAAADGPSPVAGSGVNATNPWTVAALARIGAGQVWLSPELSGRQIARIVLDSVLPVGVQVFGRTELMVAENCVLAAMGACGRRCETCSRRSRTWELVDRKGYRFPVRTDLRGRTHVYNAVTLDLSRALPELVAARVHAVAVDVTGMRQDKARKIVARVRERLTAAVAGRTADTAQLVTPATTGHFYRGVV
jgi:putative protease